MSQNSDNQKKRVEEHSEKLAKLGTELAKSQFSYKVENKPTKEYWQKRKEDFKKHAENSSEYYNEIFSLMKIINDEKSQMYLLRISKFRQLGLTLIENIEKIIENPSIMNSKDRQQSQWSRKIKNQITEHSDKCLQYETDMNSSFREFYEEYVKDILE